MSDWLSKLTPNERDDWDRFVEHFRRDALEKIGGSAAFISILPSSDELDVKFAMELGAGIMLDKPLLVIAHAGRPVPDKLRAVADEIVEADIDTLAGRTKVAEALKRMGDRL